MPSAYLCYLVLFTEFRSKSRALNQFTSPVLLFTLQPRTDVNSKTKNMILGDKLQSCHALEVYKWFSIVVVGGLILTQEVPIDLMSINISSNSFEENCSWWEAPNYKNKT